MTSVGDANRSDRGEAGDAEPANDRGLQKPLAARPARFLVSSLALIALAFALAPLYRVLPMGQPQSLAAFFSNVGFIDCLAKTAHWATCPLASLPIGLRSVEGLPMAAMAAAFERMLGLDVISSWNAAGLLLLIMSIASAFLLFRMFGVRTAWAIAGAALLYSMPILRGKLSYGFMLWGFVTLPVAAAAVVLHWRFRRITLTFGLLFSIMLFQLFQDGYSFSMATLFGAIFGGFQLLYGLRSEPRTALLKFGTWAIAILGAVVAYGLYIPESKGYAVMPMDFFRGQGIDLIAFMSRPKTTFAFPVPWGIQGLDPLRFFTDGEMVYENYLGIGLLAGIGAFFASSAFWRNARLIALTVIAVVALVLSLGPSLKINDQRPTAVKTPIQFTDYLMPTEAATASLHDSFIYRLPPMKYMRSVSRWYLLFAFVAVAMTVLALDKLSRSKRGAILAALIALLLVIEFMPNYSATVSSAKRTRNMFSELRRDTIGELSSMIAPGEKVLFIGEHGISNEYLTLYFCAAIGCRTYNASGDKAMAIARQAWPVQLQDATAAGRSPTERAAALARLLQDGTVDVIAMPHFDMRWDSYWWPPKKEAIESRAEALIEPFSLIPGIKLKSAKLFSTARSAG